MAARTCCIGVCLTPRTRCGYLGLPYAGQFVAIDAFGLAVAGLTDHGEVVVWGEDAGGVVSMAPSVYQEAVQVVLGEGFGVALLPDARFISGA